MEIKLDKYEKALEYEIFQKKEYGILDKIIEKSEIIFDIGGHIGFFSLYCCKINKNCKIHFFEPIEKSFQKSKEILKNNSKQIIFNPNAIRIQNSKQKIFFNEKKTMQSSFFNNTFLNPNGILNYVNCILLPEYCIQQKIDKIDLIKMDIEGAELDILLDIDTEFWKKVDCLFFEYHTFDEISKLKLKKVKNKLIKNFLNVSEISSQYNENIGYYFFR